jgi:hypothetical protein
MNDEATETPKAPRVVGKAAMTLLSKVEPNTWNPNRMTPFIRASLKHGLEEDGWLASQALLIWGTDQEGATKNVVIDGEHRLLVARELGFKDGPMVFLHKLTEAQAKALTVKMNQKRGAWDETALAELVRDIQFAEGDGSNLALDLGFQDDVLMALLAVPEVDMGTDLDPTARGPADGPSDAVPTSNVRMVQLFLNDTTHGEFMEHMKKLAAVYGTKTVTDTTMEAIRRADSSATGAS